jgi:hypothetical protein
MWPSKKLVSGLQYGVRICREVVARADAVEVQLPHMEIAAANVKHVLRGAVQKAGDLGRASRGGIVRIRRIPDRLVL